MFSHRRHLPQSVILDSNSNLFEKATTFQVFLAKDDKQQTLEPLFTL